MNIEYLIYANWGKQILIGHKFYLLEAFSLAGHTMNMHQNRTRQDV